jgi:1-aminocyclopropane-1-carboxylate deaminase
MKVSTVRSPAVTEYVVVDLMQSSGIPGPSTTEAMKLAARTDALITDPVYEGKSMAGMIQLIKEGSIAAGSNVLYVHLGGQPALNAYSSYFEE